jgi:hypothetical protein
MFTKIPESPRLKETWQGQTAVDAGMPDVLLPLLLLSEVKLPRVYV